MIKCEVTSLSKDFKLDDNLDFSIQEFEPRKALNAIAFKILSKEMRRNTKFEKNLTHLVVVKDLKDKALKYFKSSKIKIYIDSYNE